MSIVETPLLVVGGLIAVATLSTYSLRKYADSSVSCVSLLTSVVGFTLAWSILAVVPYDVWEALAAHHTSESQLNEDAREGEHDIGAVILHQSPHQLLSSSWKFMYWSTVWLCYVFYPVLMEFETSGDFTLRARLWWSLRRNIACYLCNISIGVAAIVWMVIRGQVRGDLASWCIALSNAWGLLLLTFLMGFGLVAVPRHLRRLASPEEELMTLRVKAIAVDEARLSRQFELQDIISQVQAEVDAARQRLTMDSSRNGDNNADDSESGVGGDSGSASHTPTVYERALATLQGTLANSEAVYRELMCRGQTSAFSHGASAKFGNTCVDEDSSSPVAPIPKCKGTPGDFLAGMPQVPSSASSTAAEPLSPPVDLQRLGALHLSLKRARLEAKRSASCWDEHVRRSIFLEDIKDEQFESASQLVVLAHHRGGWLSRFCVRQPFLRRARLGFLTLWFRSLRTRTYVALSYASGLLSAIIVLGQLTLLSKGWSLSLLAVLLAQDRGPIFTQVFCIVPLSYMTYTAYFGIFRLRISGWYGLYKRNTDSGSLLWSASLVSRLAAPLCYHFLTIARVEGTSFQAFMGQMDVTLLGKSFNQSFPMIVFLLCCLNVFNVYSKILQCLSFGVFQFDWDNQSVDAATTEGQQLIARERRRLAECMSALELEMESGLDSPVQGFSAEA
eukprot:TRINITY_DN22557_c1_g4_i1.p1 TRINITY_DN22557_c1_g4~~TRINITY_DN22557_c1_g4_i1.p1  ORF type:complete len:675 (+),score=79.00 TRINITY_DN22557_c1_g4_i1:93-2117(+)